MPPENPWNEMLSSVPEPDRMMRWFAFEHLPPHLRKVSEPFHALATTLTQLVPSGPERTVALRKLLEAKNAAVRAAVRAALHPGC